MIYKHYERKEHILAFALLIVTGFYALTQIQAATTIDTNVQTAGNLSLTNSASSIIFANGWKFSQSTATTTQVNVTDTGNNSVIIFDEN